MSNNCEHPFCNRFISTQCSNHCQLDLCEEHLIEHKNLFLAQYEKAFNNLQKVLNDAVGSMEEEKQALDNNYQKEASFINDNYKNQVNELEQKFTFVDTAEKLIKKKCQLLNDVKNGQASLYQYDVEQIKLYSTTMHEYHQNKTHKEIDKNCHDITASFYSDIDSDNEHKHKSHNNNNNNNNNDVSHFRGRCPLTHLGIYGLTKKHELPLCSPEKTKSELNLLKHFHRYHHLPRALAYKLALAIIKKSDPLTTCIFQSETVIIDQHYLPMTCPLNKLKSSSYCHRKFFRNSLRSHLLKFHHLTLTTSEKILKAIKNQRDITKLDIHENDLKKLHK